MRKHVAPAHPDASIPDPERKAFLPAGGREVDWTPYWAGLAAREDIIVSDPVSEPAPAEPEAEGAPEPAKPKRSGAPLTAD